MPFCNEATKVTRAVVYYSLTFGVLQVLCVFLEIHSVHTAALRKLISPQRMRWIQEQQISILWVHSYGELYCGYTAIVNYIVGTQPWWTILWVHSYGELYCGYTAMVNYTVGTQLWWTILWVHSYGELYCGYTAMVKTQNLWTGIKGISLQVITEIYSMQNSPMKIDILSTYATEPGPSPNSWVHRCGENTKIECG